jgi:hypothetical protein
MTALCPSHSPFLGTDPAFTTRKSLICERKEEKDASEWRRMGFEDGEVLDILEGGDDGGGKGEEKGKGVPRVWVWKFDFVLPSVEAVVEMKKSMGTKAIGMKCCWLRAVSFPGSSGILTMITYSRRATTCHSVPK